MTHTKEPWSISNNGSGSMYSVIEPFVVANGQYINTANARRIVACVNACAGIPTEHLLSLAVGALVDIEYDRVTYWDKICQLEQQRDELLAAIPDLTPVILWLRNGCSVNDAVKELEIYKSLIVKATAKAGGE